jgi:hypothetical protein
MVEITKLEAAIRQIDAAVTLVFDSGDQVVIHTLAAAAANIFSDVLESRNVSQSWREKVRSEHALSNAQYRDVVHKAWNFFKHADRNPEDVLEFDERESEYLIFFATLECGELNKLSVQMQTFQLWFLASNAIDFGEGAEIQKMARLSFPNMGSLSRSDQLHLGRKMLAEQIKEPFDEAY